MENVLCPSTYKALIELGKAVKTIFLCHYLQSDGLRASLAASAGGKIPLMELGLVGQVSRSGSAENTALLSDIKQFADTTNIGESWGQVLQASEQLSSQRAESVGDSDSQSVQASLQSAVRAQASSSTSMSEARAWESAASRTEQSGFSASFDAVGAIRNSMIGQEKGAVTIGSSSSTWISNDVDNLFQSAAAGNTGAMSILLNESRSFGAEHGLELAGVANGVGGSGDAQSFYSDSSAGIAGGGAVDAQHESNAGAVLYNEARVDSNLPRTESDVKSAAIRADNSVNTVKSATDSELDKVRKNLDDQGAAQRSNYDEWRDANIPGAADDWIPGLGN